MQPTKTCCVKCNNFRKFVNLNISYIFNKTVVLSIICSKCGDNNDRICKVKESTEILKINDLIK